MLVLAKFELPPRFQLAIELPFKALPGLSFVGQLLLLLMMVGRATAKDWLRSFRLDRRISAGA